MCVCVCVERETETEREYFEVINTFQMFLQIQQNSSRIPFQPLPHSSGEASDKETAAFLCLEPTDLSAAFRANQFFHLPSGLRSLTAEVVACFFLFTIPNFS